MKIASFGGGTNSTAMIIKDTLNGIIYDYILFADTGSEKPYTYEHIEEFSDWLEKHNQPRITIIKYLDKHGRVLTLYEDCIKGCKLPSIAYGKHFKSCSVRFKIFVQERYVKNEIPEAKKIWESGQRIKRYIGYDAGEPQRKENAKDIDRANKFYENQYPLIDKYNMDRKDCIKIIEDQNIKPPKKSSCFFCPNTKKSEIVELYNDYPILFNQAVFMEEMADLTSIEGLGRTFSWKQFMINYNNQINWFGTIDEQLMKDDKDVMPCGCYD